MIMVSIANLALVRILSHCLWCLTCKLSVFFFLSFPFSKMYTGILITGLISCFSACEVHPFEVMFSCKL